MQAADLVQASIYDRTGPSWVYNGHNEVAQWYTMKEAKETANEYVEKFIATITEAKNTST